MPRRAKGPRLYLREGREGREAAWVIRDGTRERSTGCPQSSLGEAERKLAEYIAHKWRPGAAEERNRRDPAQVGVDDVLALYAMEKAPALKADPKSTAGFITHLNGWWGDKKLSDVRRSTCQAYVTHRTGQAIRHGQSGRMVTDQTARRELETLSAAIGYWHGEDHLDNRPVVWLPPKAESPRDALTRSQAAALLWAAMGWRKGGDGRWVRDNRTTIANRRHMRRFILIGLYTGSRSGVIKAMLWHESATNAWADLDKGMVFRRGKAERETANKRRPVVKLPHRLLAHMRRWRRKDAERAAEDQKSQNNQRPEHGAELRFLSVIHFGGEPVQKVRRGFAGCVADAGLSDEVTPHWLRHTCATWLMENGAEIWEAAAYTGMTPKVLTDHYGHHRPGHQAGAIRAIGGRR